MQKLLRTLGMAILASSVAACGLVYVPDVQQGNLLDKKTVEQLQPGMTKRQVLVLMGSPSVNSPFYQNRWDYVSTVAHRGGPMKVRTFSLSFNNDVLVSTKGDFFAADAEAILKDQKKYHQDYPTTDTQGDKNTDPDAKKSDDGGFGSGSGDDKK